jgi:signal transduction histidine kinase/D-alanyl-D-alanine dipeptidase
LSKLEYQNYLDNKAITINCLILGNQILKLFSRQLRNQVEYISLKKQMVPPRGTIYIFPNNHLNKIAKTTKAVINDIIIRDNKISYGLYVKDSLYEQSGFFNYKKNYPYTPETINEKEDLYGIDFEHSIKKVGSDVKVIITTQQTNPVSILTQFSYIFCINFILALLLLFIAWLLRISYLGMHVFHLKDLRSKIVLAIFLIVIGIFSGITFLSFNSLRDKFLNYNQEVKYNNLKVTQKATEEYFNHDGHQPETMVDEFFKKIKSLSSIHYELYNDKGLLIKTSKSNFLNEIYPRLLNPEVFQELNSETEAILEKKKDPLATSKIEAYSKLFNRKTNKPTYLRLTAEEETNSQNDEMRLMVVLINLYVIFFLISMAFAIWLANRITQPLQSLAQRISILGLSKQNEYLEYKYEDEIGELVKRYNIMVDEIQESARQLAEQQREEAWSEMAKQIAHEIKNPLTPMKLKIQFLQKKMKDGAENINQLVQSTAETLIEQINNLDNIASSFSNFARLHTPYMESLDWIPLIKSVTNVFNNKMTNVHFMSYLSSAYIQGDRNQMISCLNNLVKNAIQAYDEEEATVDLVLDENHENYILIIKDYGKGIKEEEQDKIFIPNFTTKNSGSGLGLAITKKILAAMNGQIRFESKLGVGTSFYISIPKLKEMKQIQFTALEKEWNDKGLKPIIDDSIYSALEYVQEINVFNQKFYNEFEKPFLHLIAYNKLLKARNILIENYPNYRLVIKDALRPYAIQKAMWESYSGDDKDIYIAPPERDSMHNYGMAVDVLILEEYIDVLTPNRLLDFGSPFDEFSERSHIDYSGLTEIQKKNRKLLKDIMLQAGFAAYANEYWHFEAMDKNWVRENCERL